MASRKLLWIIPLVMLLAGCSQATPTPSAPAATPTQEPTQLPTPTDTPDPTPTMTPIPVDAETRKTLEEVQVQPADPIELAYRLGGVQEEIPPTLDPPAAPPKLGDQDTFWVTNDRNESFEVNATLQYVTDHGYFWVDDDALYEQDQLERLGNAFENRIYPTTRAFFGSEWSPGIDGDEHIYILYARRLGFYVGGYFSSSDSQHPLVSEHSNAHEMFVFNADNMELDDEYTYGVLAHEFQHMIHWNVDMNETTWLNEGMSELSSLLNRYDPGGLDRVYADDPDLQLNDWPVVDDTAPHYGASFLFAAYLLDRLGEENMRALVAHPADGLESLDLLLEEKDLTDPLTGNLLTADDLVTDWALANLIGDDEVGDGRYDYQRYIGAPRTRQTDVIRNCDPESEPLSFDVHQYGVDYIRILCPGDFTLRFDGAEETTLLPTETFSGDYSFWSNKGDSSDMSLSRSFDFSDHTGSLTLSFQTWFAIEKDWDYIYLLASTDGENWEMLEPPLGTDRDPIGNNYGYGWTGSTRGGEWVEERVDLSQYAGQQVTLRFEYVTDAAVYDEGMLIDDVAIEEIGYFSDFESDDGGWEANGWARVKNTLPQTFRLALIRQGEDTQVELLQAGINNVTDVPLSLAEEGESVILMVIGATRFTRQPANYTISFLP